MHELAVEDDHHRLKSVTIFKNVHSFLIDGQTVADVFLYWCVLEPLIAILMQP